MLIEVRSANYSDTWKHLYRKSSWEDLHFVIYLQQETHGPRFAQLSKTAITYLQMQCNILPVLLQQLGTQIWRTAKSRRSSQDHHLNKLGRPWVLDSLYQDSASKLSLYLGEKTLRLTGVQLLDFVCFSISFISCSRIFIVVSSLYSFDFMFLEMLHWWVRNPLRGLNKCLLYTTAEIRTRVVVSPTVSPNLL